MPPPPPLRTNRTRRAPHPVLIGHACRDRSWSGRRGDFARSALRGKAAGGGMLFVHVTIERLQARTRSAAVSVAQGCRWDQKMAFGACSERSLIDIRVVEEGSNAALATAQIQARDAPPVKPLRGQREGAGAEQEVCTASGEFTVLGRSRACSQLGDDERHLWGRGGVSRAISGGMGATACGAGAGGSPARAAGRHAVVLTFVHANEAGPAGSMRPSWRSAVRWRLAVPLCVCSVGGGRFKRDVQYTAEVGLRSWRCPPPPPRTKWTRRVPHPVLNWTRRGHVHCVSVNATVHARSLHDRNGAFDHRHSRWGRVASRRSAARFTARANLWRRRRALPGPHEEDTLCPSARPVRLPLSSVPQTH